MLINENDSKNIKKYKSPIEKKLEQSEAAKQTSCRATSNQRFLRSGFLKTLFTYYVNTFFHKIMFFNLAGIKFLH